MNSPQPTTLKIVPPDPHWHEEFQQIAYLIAFLSQANQYYGTDLGSQLIVMQFDQAQNRILKQPVISLIQVGDEAVEDEVDSHQV